MNAIQTSFGKALYYPHIEVQDVNWLKLALLYWDGLRRIVPAPISPNDSPEVRSVVDEGLLENTSPKRYLEIAEETFINEFSALFHPQHAVNNHDERTTSLMIQNATQVIQNATHGFLQSEVPEIKSIVDSERLFYIDKISFDLIRMLTDLNLAEEYGDKLLINKAIGGLYMMCLASAISTSIGTPLVTDMSQFASCGEYLSFGQSKVSRSLEPFGVLLKLNIKFPTSKSLEQIPISKILKFREQHKDERRRFRQAIEKITATANTISDPNKLADFFSEQREEFKSAIEDQYKVLDELSVKSVGSLLGVTAPTAIASVAGLTVPPVAMALTGVGIAVSLISWWAEVRGNRREKTQKSPWHYLLSTERFT